MARSTVERTLRECRKRGWPCASLEKWVAIPGHPGGGVRRDLWGVGDVIAVDPSQKGSLLIQAVAGRGDVSKHLHKLVALVRDWEPPASHPLLPEPISTWIAQDNRLAIWSFAKRGPRGGRKLWTVVEHNIEPDDLAAMLVSKETPF